MSQCKEWFGSAKKKSVALVLLLSVGLVQAGLSSGMQNEKDLEVMLSYVKSHSEVLSGLQAIDLGMLTVYYGSGCSAEFTRNVVKRSKGWIGPAEPLILKKKSCPEVRVNEPLEGDGLGSITSRVTDSCGSEVVVKSEGCKITPGS